MVDDHLNSEKTSDFETDFDSVEKDSYNESFEVATKAEAKDSNYYADKGIKT